VYRSLPSWFKSVFLFEFPLYSRNFPEEGSAWWDTNIIFLLFLFLFWHVIDKSTFLFMGCSWIVMCIFQEVIPTCYDWNACRIEPVKLQGDKICSFVLPFQPLSLLPIIVVFVWLLLLFILLVEDLSSIFLLPPFFYLPCGTISPFHVDFFLSKYSWCWEANEELN
jgi:hypothetical protein